MSVVKPLRYMIAGSLVMVTPVQSASAAVRPSAAIPAATAAVPAQSEEAAAGASLAWPAISVIIATIIAAIIIERHDGRGRGTGFSR